MYCSVNGVDKIPFEHMLNVLSLDIYPVVYFKGFKQG